ncbi:hypothetical protein CTEN210_08450 [Chaetoceros tenuissimus]|uniref:thioredoxin-dependent peroxiredoxin n=1 Tax=Chaetoceros tenuissimus TaxID=426638 RepID=A0AAD3CWP8_9STRA|nr:hypothetical protein CTEN210_08450 [Chaetoceros tenuissimus]
MTVLGFSMSMSTSQEHLARRSFIGSMGATAAGLCGMSCTPKIANAATSGATASVGVKAPSFELANSKGGMTSLESLLQDKKYTILYFYPGAFSKGCTLESIAFQRDVEKYKALNAQIVGISVDSVEKNAQFCAEEKLDFFMLSDKGGKVSKLYGSALSIPGFGTFSNRQTYIIAPTGELKWVFTDVESHVTRHSDEVLEKLEEIQKEA